MPVPIVAEPISRVPTRETVACTLRDWIVDGTLASGEVLRDADIATTFGISRTPVREALLQLEHEGLVESQPGRWTRVALLDPTQLVTIYPVWSELEALVARLAATEAEHLPSEREIEEAAQAFCDVATAAQSTGDIELLRAARQADARFHDSLLNVAGNPMLSTTLVPLRLAIRRFENAQDHDTFACHSAALNDHAVIVAYVSNGDAEAAAHASRAHARHTHQAICRAWNVPAPY